VKLRYRDIPRKLCAYCGFVMLEVETVCLSCEDAADRRYLELRELAKSRSIPR